MTSSGGLRSEEKGVDIGIDSLQLIVLGADWAMNWARANGGGHCRILIAESNGSDVVNSVRSAIAELLVFIILPIISKT